MSERKTSLHLLQPTPSSKHLQPYSISNHYKKQRSTLQPSNYGSTGGSHSKMPKYNKNDNKYEKGRQTFKKEKSGFVKVEKENHVQEPMNRMSLEEGLLNKLKRLGYVSGISSRHLSPSVQEQSYDLNDKHRKNLSNHQENFVSAELTPTQKPQEKKAHNFNKGVFNYRHVIGKGGFGKVWKVELKRNGKLYALKQMSKALIIAKKSVPSVMNEKKLLATLKNDFLVNMVQSFQDRQCLYLVMDYLPGGDLRHMLSKHHSSFTEEQTKFTIACIIIALEYLHAKNIIHRDIKPENLVLDQRGYVRVTDLGVARVLRTQNSSDTSGTPGYMAPEVLCRQNHTFSVDHFAVGVIGYEMMLRRRPYFGRSRKEIRDEILSKQVQIKKPEIPEDWSLEGADFLNRLIQRKPANRLGSNSSRELLNHPWLRQYPFQKLLRKEYPSPLLNIQQSKRKSGHILVSSQNTETKQLIMQNQIMLRNEEVQKLFQGYQSHNK